MPLFHSNQTKLCEEYFSQFLGMYIYIIFEAVNKIHATIGSYTSREEKKQSKEERFRGSIL
jgi:hypothetical protein